MRLAGIALLLAACGRFGFDPTGPGVGDGGGDTSMFTDAPAVPSTVCSVSRSPVSGVPANADLAIAPTGTGFVAMWADAASGGAVHGAVLGPQGEIAMTRVIPGLSTRVVGGVADAGSVFVVAVGSDSGTQAWTVPHDLSSATMIFGLPTGITGRDPFPSDDTQTLRVFVVGDSNALDLYNVSSDGSIALSSSFTTTGPVTSFAGTDGPNHAHLVWTETITGMSQCTAADIRWQSPTMPAVQGTEVLSGDCFELRNDTGPLPPDGMMIVWTTTPHTVEGLYIVSTGNVPGQISMQGRAPRTRYDGTRQWVSWIDETAGDELRIGIFDIATGALTPSRLPGWHPAGDEALELVLKGNTTLLAVLSPDSLSLLRLCP